MFTISENRRRYLTWQLEDTTERNKNGCWLWTRCRNKNGYGSVKVDYKHWYAHRLSFAIFKGIIPGGMCVCHACDTPSCVNPEHLWLGTRKENQQDMARKGRASKSYYGGGFKIGHTHSRGNRQGKLSNDAVREIRSSQERLLILAARYSVSMSAISNVRNNKRKQLVA